MTEDVREEELERIRQVEASPEYQQVCGDSDYGCIGICFSLPPI